MNARDSPKDTLEGISRHNAIGQQGVSLSRRRARGEDDHLRAYLKACLCEDTLRGGSVVASMGCLASGGRPL